MKDELPRIAGRLASIKLTCRPALDSIRDVDSLYGSDAVHYCDPPYLHSTRTAKKAYEFEMDADSHRELLDVLDGCKGAVFLSGYRSPMYDDRLSRWHRVDFDLPNHSGQGATKQRRIECVWSNRPLPGSEPAR